MISHAKYHQLVVWAQALKNNIDSWAQADVHLNCIPARPVNMMQFPWTATSSPHDNGKVCCPTLMLLLFNLFSMFFSIKQEVSDEY